MGSMDLNDQLCGYYMTRRKSTKWWHCLLWFLVDNFVLPMPTFWRNCQDATWTEVSLLFALTCSRIWSEIFLQGNCLLVLHGLKEDTGLYPTAKVTVSATWSEGKLLGAGWLVKCVTNTFVWSAFEIILQRILCNQWYTVQNFTFQRTFIFVPLANVYPFRMLKIAA